jgi:hypothetical protein
MNTQDHRIIQSVPDPNQESDFWKPTYIGIGRKIASKAQEAMRRARHCAMTNNKRRMSAHLRTYDRALHGVFTGHERTTVLLTRKDLRITRHQAIFVSSGTGRG